MKSKYEKLYKPSGNSKDDISKLAEVTCPKGYGKTTRTSNKGFSLKNAGLGTLLFEALELSLQ